MVLAELAVKVVISQLADRYQTLQTGIHVAVLIVVPEAHNSFF